MSPEWFGLVCMRVFRRIVRAITSRLGGSLRIARSLPAKRGWEIVERYVDSDISAYGGKARPEYRRLLEEIEARLIDAVVVYHADRLHRHPKELRSSSISASGRRRSLATVSGDLDLSTHEGQLMARITGAVAKKESDDKSRRIRRKHQEIALAGRPSGGGTRPFGYESDHRTARPAEAAVIRECAARALAGDSLRSICIDLNDRQVPTVQGCTVESADVAADADVGPDQRAAGASRRDRRPG